MPPDSRLFARSHPTGADENAIPRSYCAPLTLLPRPILLYLVKHTEGGIVVAVVTTELNQVVQPASPPCVYKHEVVHISKRLSARVGCARYEWD